MASLYKRNRSKFYWIKFRDPATRKVCQEPTEFEHANPAHRQRAREFVAEKTFHESKAPKASSSHRWHLWVLPFLDARHATDDEADLKTLTRKLTAWRTLSDYLAEKEVNTPEQLTRQHCLNYVSWRKQRGHGRAKHKKKRLSNNTIILELKVLSSIVQEAVRREWVHANVCHRLEIPRDVVREKNELDDDDIRFIREEIARRVQKAESVEEKRNASFLHVSFEIALAQGVRMFETWLPLSDIDLEKMEISLLAKGKRRYVAPLNPSLVPLIKELKASGRTHTYDRPRMPSLVWFNLFDRLRSLRPSLAKASFHSSRVTVVSRAERNGVPEKVAMALVNHSSTTVHRIYRKIKKQELSAIWSALDSLNPNEGQKKPHCCPDTESSEVKDSQ